MGSSENICCDLCDTLALGKGQFLDDTVMTSITLGVNGTKELSSFNVQIH